MVKRIFRIFLIQLIIILSIFSYFYYTNVYSKVTQIDNLEIFNSREDSKELSLNGITTYDKLERALLNGEKEIYLKKDLEYTQPKEIFDALQEITLKNPKIMYYKGAEYSLGKFSIWYSRDVEDIKKHQGEIEIIRDKFIKDTIIENMSDYEKVLKVHDYIILNSRYDERLEESGTVPPESNSSYGVLALGVGVCDGYAKAMKYLLDGLNIESMIIVGKAKGENHAWNLVNINGEYYHIDPTWDDPVMGDGSQILRYNYFNLTDDEISKSHSWDRTKYPVANSQEYNYYNYNDLIILGEKEIKDKLREALFSRKDEFSGKILNGRHMNINLDKIIEEIVYKDQKWIKLKSYSYFTDKEQGIIDFKFSYY